MTVNSETNKTTYAGDGATVSFSTGFTFASDDEITVTLVTDATGAETTWTDGTQYTLTGAGSGNNGTLTVDTAPTDYTPASGETLVIELEPDFTQTTALPRGGTVSPKDTLEPMHDKRVRQILRVKDLVDRSLKVSIAESSIANLPNVANRKNKILGFDANGDPEMQDAVVIPDNLTALNYIRVVVAGDVYEMRTPTEVRTDISAQPLDATLTALAAYNSDGLLTQTAADTFAARTITGTASEITVTNGDGVAGNPTISLPASISATDLTLSGDLTVNGTTVTLNITNQVSTDPLIELNNGAASNANDLGVIMERGSTGNNFWMGWDESADEFVAVLTTSTGASTGNLVMSSYANARFNDVAMAQLTATSGTLAGLTSLAMSGGATLTAGFLDEDDMASDSAVAGVTQQSAKAYIDASMIAPGLPMTWDSDTDDADKGDGRVWLNHATPASATAIYFDDNLNNGTTDISAFIATLDDPTATNSAIITITEGGAGGAMVSFQVTGAVTEGAGGTHKIVDVTGGHIATVGTFTDADIVGVSFAFSGDNGLFSGSEGTVTAAAGDLVALKDVDDSNNPKFATAQSIVDLGGASVDTQTFTGSGTWTKPGSGNITLIECWGGGGSGGSGNGAATHGGGGAGGGYSAKLILTSALGATETVTIGAGGAGVTGASDGNAGGQTSFSSATNLVTAYGGGAGGDGVTDGGGSGAAGGTDYAVGGSAVGTTIGVNFFGQGASDNANAGEGGAYAYAAAGAGGSSIYGGGGGGGGSRDNAGGAAGSTVWGGGGGGGAGATAQGAAGTSRYGGAGSAGVGGGGNSDAGAQPSGGSGGVDTGTSGAGGAGKCIVRTW